MKTIILFIALASLALTVPAQPLPEIQLKQVFTKMTDERPVWISEAPDGTGRLFVVYQDGKILITKKGSDGGDAKTFFDITSRHPHFQNEDGLLSIAFHPGFKTNGLFYVFYTQKNPADQHTQPQNYPFRSIVSEFKISADDADQADMKSERILLEVPGPFWNHKGGELAFGPDGYLYIGLGDGGAGGDPFGSGQSTTTLLAKILRIDVNSHSIAREGRQREQLPYGIPSDNPFVHDGNGVRHEIYAYGLRNPWRFSWDAKTGALWCGDVGQDLWEEVDIITNGGNYGWSVREGMHFYKPGPADAHYVDPVIEYPHRPNLQSEGMFPDHSIGLCVIGGYVYRGKAFPNLDGIYFYGDASLGTIWGLRYDYTTHKVTAHGTLIQQPKNINSFAEDADGELYVLTLDGKIYQITAP